MTWTDYNRVVYGHIKKETKQWEHTRSIVAMLYNTNVGKKHDQKAADKLMPLWTDNLGKPKKPKQEPLTKEDFHKVANKLNNNG